jgi:hypothetical protein
VVKVKSYSNLLAWIVRNPDAMKDFIRYISPHEKNQHKYPGGDPDNKGIHLFSLHFLATLGMGPPAWRRFETAM